MGIRIAVALIAAWYGTLLAFSLAFPQCSPGSFVDSVCIVLETGLHRKTRTD